MSKLLYPPSPIVPAVFATSPEVFKQRLAFAESTAGAVHIDVIDGEFCPGATLPLEHWPPVTSSYSEVHLMVKRPLEYFAQLAEKKITRVIVHVESQFDVEELHRQAKSLDLLLGLAINPDTDLDRLRPYYELTSYIQIMGVHPGRTGQAFLEPARLAVSYLKHLPNRRLLLSVDGGVTAENITSLKDAGAHYFVTTHAIFDHANWQKGLDSLIAQIKEVPA